MARGNLLYDIRSSLQHRTLLLSPVTCTAGYCFCFGFIPSFFLELFLHWPPVAYWIPIDLGSSSFSILPFCLFIPFMGFSRQEFAIPFFSGPHSVRPLHHDPLLLGCPAGMAWLHWVREGCGPSVIRLTSFLRLWFQCVCPLMPSHNTYRFTTTVLPLPKPPMI